MLFAKKFLPVGATWWVSAGPHQWNLGFLGGTGSSTCQGVWGVRLGRRLSRLTGPAGTWVGNGETLAVSSGGAGEQRRLMTWETRALFTVVQTCLPKMKMGLFVQCLEVI